MANRENVFLKVFLMLSQNAPQYELRQGGVWV